jgi:hypothetical protein
VNRLGANAGLLEMLGDAIRAVLRAREHEVEGGSTAASRKGNPLLTAIVTFLDR